MEVVELRLDQEERLRLNEYSFYFEDDAWLAVGANIQHSTEAQGLIVPVFTESEDEKFWLFYYPESIKTSQSIIYLQAKRVLA